MTIKIIGDIEVIIEIAIVFIIHKPIANATRFGATITVMIEIEIAISIQTYINSVCGTSTNVFSRNL